MGNLHLALFGTPEVRHGDSVVQFRTRKTLGLLIYLALQPGNHTRAALASLLWPDGSDERSRGMLRTTVRFLRQALDETGDKTHAGHLDVRREVMALNPAAPLSLDLQIVAEAVKQPVGPRDTASERVDLCRAAVSAYRGDFLAGWLPGDSAPFEEWAAQQREHWHLRMSQVYERLAHLQADGGDLTAALETANRWLAHDPLHEGTYRRLMQLYFALGDRDAAQRSYQACRSMLASSLGVEPSPETEALAARLRSAPQAARPAESEPQASPAALELPLVGRVSEFAGLVELFYRARRGRQQVVLLAGEAGIGKTRLAQDLARWAASQGADVWQGRAFEAGGRVPYQPLAEALRQRLERENAPEDLLADVWLAELSRLFPELRERYPDLPAAPAIEDAAARSRLFEAVSRLGAAWAARAAVVWLIDDLQWADTASLDLLQVTIRNWYAAGTPILLVCTLRSEAGDDPALRDWITSLRRDTALTRFDLTRLGSDDTTRLVRSLAEGDAEGEGREQYGDVTRAAVERFARWLFNETQGQPFFIVETLNSLLQQGILSVQQGSLGRTLDLGGFLSSDLEAHGFTPARVREVIQARLARLNGTGSALVTAAAVLGRGFDFEGVCRVAGIDENAALPAFDELVTQRLIRENPAPERARGSHAYVFAHDKLREVIYAEAGAARRQVFHRRALASLEAAGLPAAELAYHALAAGLPAAALRFYVAAGNDALALFALQEAGDHYEQARQLWESGGVGPEPPDILPLVSDLYAQLGRTYQLGSRLDRARAVYEAMLSQARALRRPRMECLALNRLATVAAHDTVDVSTARELLQQALAVAGAAADDESVAETEWNLAQINFYAYAPEISRVHAGRALHLARGLGLDDLSARSLNVMAYAEMVSGQWQAAEPHALEAQALFARLGNRVMEVDCLNLVSNARVRVGRHQEGIASARRARALSRDMDNAWAQADGAMSLACGLLDSGDYSAALEAAAEGVRVAREHRITPLLISMLLNLGAVQRAMFDIQTALVTHREALAIQVQYRLPRPFATMISGELAADCALAGEWASAAEFATQSLAIRDYMFLPVGLSRWLEIEALLRGGSDPAAVSADVQAFERYSTANLRYRIPYLRSAAVVARWTGDATGALRSLEAARTLSVELALPGQERSIEAARAALYRETGDRGQAEAAQAAAVRLAGSLAATIADETLRRSFLAGALRDGDTQ